jgi:hypothetical protein
MTPVFVRIFLRYLAGYLLLKGFVPQGMADQIASDPDLAAALGVTVMVGVEGFYFMAHKFGWAK